MDATDQPGLARHQGDVTGAPVRVLIVDDHDVLADGWQHVIDAEADMVTVGVAGTMEQARELMPAAEPDVILLGHALPDGDGVAVMPELRQLRPGVRIVILTADTSEDVLVAALEHGAAGFVPKTRSLGEVTSAVRAAAAGEAVISPELLARLLPRLRRHDNPARSGLTAREHEVLVLLSGGLTNAAIARHLSLSVHTVRSHVADLSHKLGAHSKLEALAVAVRHGLLPEV